MSKASRVLILSAVAVLGTCFLAPARSFAQGAVPAAGCEEPVAAVAGFIDAWFASFLTNGAAGFSKICQRICKAGSKGCDQVRRQTVACNESSAGALFSVNEAQCREFEGIEREECLDGVEGLAAAFAADLAALAADAALECSDAAEDCSTFCGPS